MKILVVASTFPTSEIPNAPSFVRTLSSVFGDSHEVDVVTLQRGDRARTRSEKFERVSVTVVCGSHRQKQSTGLISAWSVRRIPSEVLLIARWCWKIIAMIRKHRYELIHIHWAFPIPPLIRVCRAFRLISKECIYVVTLHGADVLLLDTRLSKIVSFGLSGAGYATTVTQRDAKLVSRATNGRVNVRSEPMPVADRFANSNDVGERSTRDKNLLFVGRFVDKKGVDTLVSAIKAGAGQGRTLRLIGSGPMVSDSEEDPRVRVLGPLPPADVAKQMKSSALLVCPFRESARDRDGLPVVLLEAMASGIPILTTNIAGVTELESLGARFYTLDKNFALADLSHRIDEVVSILDTNPEDAEKMVRENLELVEHFSSTEVAKRYEQIFSEALRLGGHT